VGLPEGEFTVTYSGRSMSCEMVYVNDWVAERATNPLWFVPVFVFPIGRRLGSVEVRVWPWLTTRPLHLIAEQEAGWSMNRSSRTTSTATSSSPTTSRRGSRFR
jgi:hypothetical protein